MFVLFNQVPPPNHGKVRIAPVSAVAMAGARSRDPRLLKMHNQMEVANAQGHAAKVEQEMSGFSGISLSSSVRSLPRIPKHSKSSTSTREDRDDSRKRPSNTNGEKSSHRSKSSSSSKSPSKKSGHESSRKREDEKKSLKSSHKSSSSHRHSSSSKSPSKSQESAPKDIDLRFLVGDIDMRPDSTTMAAAAAAESKVNKNKLLNELLHDEDMKSSQDSMISTSNDNGKEQKLEFKIFSFEIVDKNCVIINFAIAKISPTIYYDDNKMRNVIVECRV